MEEHILTLLFVFQAMDEGQSTAQFGKTGFRERHRVMHQADTIIQREDTVLFWSFLCNLGKPLRSVKYTV